MDKKDDSDQGTNSFIFGADFEIYDIFVERELQTIAEEYTVAVGKNDWKEAHDLLLKRFLLLQEYSRELKKAAKKKMEE